MALIVSIAICLIGGQLACGTGGVTGVYDSTTGVLDATACVGKG